MLPIATVVAPTESSLERLTANTLNLYLKAKCYHLNVTGPRFYGDHKTYDGIAETAMEWFDTFAERMRTLGFKVPSNIMWMEENEMFAPADPDLNADEMAEDLLTSMENVSAYIQVACDDMDDTTLNIAQEFDADLGKHIYFVRSSI
ncbi:MAG: ferritin-like domain-containing protein [Fusobacteriaceae bacterium]